MSLPEWWAKTPKNKIEKRIKKVLKRKIYTPYWDAPSNKWKILRSQRIKNYVVLLCEKEDWAVFIDLIKPRSIPTDYFYGSLISAEEAFVRETYRLYYEQN